MKLVMSSEHSPESGRILLPLGNSIIEAYKKYSRTHPKQDQEAIEGVKVISQLKPNGIEMRYFNVLGLTENQKINIISACAMVPAYALESFQKIF